MASRRKSWWANPNLPSKPPRNTQSKTKTDTDIEALPLELQQLILQQFTLAFPSPLTDLTQLKSNIQTVKSHLYNRSFTLAFSQPQYLEAYALRWSAARSLGYASLLTQLSKQYDLLPEPGTVLSIGGGAGAELVSLASVFAHNGPGKVRLTAVDVADWSSVLDSLQRAMNAPPPLSAYASERARQANSAFVPEGNLDMEFIHADILDGWEERLRGKLKEARLVTIMFTLNELFGASRAKTTKMLLDLSELMEVGAWLLVVDSPGSYSEVTLGGAQPQSNIAENDARGEADTTGKSGGGTSKKYPMQWLLQHTLMNVAKGKWTREVSDDSQWFRVDKRMQYPLELENMRYQVHLYKRV